VKLVTIFASAVASLVVMSTLAAAAGSERADYGDAPDGRPTGYGPRGGFPSLAKSDGARAATTSYAHLGKDVTRELDSLQVDQDRRDDGVFVRLVPCQASEALVLVTLPSAGQPARGTGFLNLFIDWNRDGRWAGADERCGGKPPPEWAVRNSPVNLTRQAGREQLYGVRFRAGLLVGPVWARAVLSVDERLRDENGRGGFARGEVEDSLIGLKVGGAFLDCSAQKIAHGKSGPFYIDLFGDPGDRIVSAQLLVTPAVTAERTITPTATISADGLRARFTYTSRKRDRRQNPVVVDTPRILVKARIDGKDENVDGTCTVVVVHESAPASAPPGGSAPPGSAPPGGGGATGAPRLGWYSGPAANFGAIDFRVDKAGSGTTVQKLQFSTRITCTKGVTSHHVHVSGSFPVRTASGRPTFSARTSAFELFGQPLRPSGTVTIDGRYGSGTGWTGTLRLAYTEPALGSCDTSAVTWHAPPAARPTHTHP
jgi:hypothetical protein